MTMYRRCTITGRDDVAGRRAGNRVLDVIRCTPISLIVQAKKSQYSPLCRRFLACTLEEISCVICIRYFSAVL